MKIKQSIIVTALVALGIGLSGCGGGEQASTGGSAAVAKPQKVIKWKMVTTWPKNFPGLGTAANNMAELIEAMSGGRMEVKVYGAQELVGALEVFDAVSRGTAEIGHGASYYWGGKFAAAELFSTRPFGMTSQERNSWLYYGGGMELWREAYEPFGLVPLAAGNTGVQMGGWFNREINSTEDLQGLKMRIPGLGGEVFRRAGGISVLLPGGELFTSLQTGAIDATEWVGPYNDLAFGLHKVAKYYYYPGWHEPGTTLEAMVNKEAYEALPADLQAIVAAAAKAVNLDMSAEFTARNGAALKTLVEEHQVEVRLFPNDVMRTLREISQQVVLELAESDPMAKRVYDSLVAFDDQVADWQRISEKAYLEVRDAE